MEFNRKLQELRKQRGLTQEELAEALYVSRTAVSKWESGRGYPGIDSLKAISEFFSISIDELLSGRELLAAAESDNGRKTQRLRDIVFGMLDCSVSMFLFLPFFGQKIDDIIYEVPLFMLTETMWYIKLPYIILIIGTIIWGIVTLAAQSCTAARWPRLKSIVSLCLSALSCLLFILSMQPYAAMFTLFFLILKGMLLKKL